MDRSLPSFGLCEPYQPPCLSHCNRTTPPDQNLRKVIQQKIHKPYPQEEKNIGDWPDQNGDIVFTYT